MISFEENFQMKVRKCFGNFWQFLAIFGNSPQEELQGVKALTKN
jgi:hypothetical protein|tara:strand:- start:582 stop:713 length:132 start_codon:yes stop_codon:yes gene_type:complete